jgi:putative transposase
LDALVRKIARDRGWIIVASEVMPDHVDILPRVGPADSPAEVSRDLRGRSARVLRSEIPSLRRQHVECSKSNFFASIGDVREPTVRRYLERP